MTKATQKRKHSIRACLDLEGGARQTAGTGAIAESSRAETSIRGRERGRGHEKGREGGRSGREGKKWGVGPENGMGF